jgi:hypothetical protein
MVGSQTVQRLLFGEGFVALGATVSLHGSVSVFEAAKFLGLTITAIACHLTFLGQDIK